MGSCRLKYDLIKDNKKLNTDNYLLSMKECDNKTNIYLRVDKPKNNSCISTITWAKDYEFIKKITN